VHLYSCRCTCQQLVEPESVQQHWVTLLRLLLLLIACTVHVPSEPLSRARSSWLKAHAAF
jgi:hypothetical protein